HGHGRARAKDHGGSARHADLNLRAAYLHVLTDAATSVFAIIALLGGKYWGASWLDPLMGIVGAVVVAIWAKGLLVDCARVLLDAEMDDPVVVRVRRLLATAPVPVNLDDLHIWRVSHQKYACIMSVSVPAGGGSSAAEPLSAAVVHRLLAAETRIVHLTVEING
ncbi:MAG: cation diffusion facilitator family transporter, partial [Lautropia sp.]|nr:cation diffusion facilitator family transporter [Lautropia sp.]